MLCRDEKGRGRKFSVGPAKLWPHLTNFTRGGTRLWRKAGSPHYRSNGKKRRFTKAGSKNSQNCLFANRKRRERVEEQQEKLRTNERGGKKTELSI